MKKICQVRPFSKIENLYINVSNTHYVTVAMNLCACIQSFGVSIKTFTQALAERGYCSISECSNTLHTPEALTRKEYVDHGAFFALGFCVPALVLMLLAVYDTSSRKSQDKKFT